MFDSIIGVGWDVTCLKNCSLIIKRGLITNLLTRIRNFSVVLTCVTPFIQNDTWLVYPLSFGSTKIKIKLSFWSFMETQVWVSGCTVTGSKKLSCSLSVLSKSLILSLPPSRVSLIIFLRAFRVIVNNSPFPISITRLSGFISSICLSEVHNWVSSEQWDFPQRKLLLVLLNFSNGRK